MATEKRNSGVVTSSSRAVANSANATGTFRPAVHAFQRKPIDNKQEGNTQTSDSGRGMAAVAPFQLKSGNAGVIQKKVLINGFPAVALGGKKAMVGNTVMDAPGAGESWISDGYARKYESVEEFEAHAGGKEVGFGLAKRLGLWYRLEPLENKKFFVLGEFHNGFGYRELMNESNQKGKVLGEGGSNTLMTATPTSALEKNEADVALKDERGESREYTMENTVSKAYYGLTRFRIAEKNKSKPAVVDDTEKEAGDVWLANYQHADKKDRDKDAGHIPYYNKLGKKVYAQHGTAAENYNVGNTGKGVLTKFWKAIDGKSVRNGYEADAWLPTKYFIQEYKTGPWDGKAEDQYNLLLGVLEKGAIAETNLLAGSNGDHVAPFLDKVQERTLRTGKAATHSEKSFAHRNFAMYHSVIKASRGGFVMAGMGDFHAQDLKEPLERAGIEVITLNEFLASSKDAITPMTEQDKKFGEKESRQDDAKREYLEELENIRREKEEEKKAATSTAETAVNPTFGEIENETVPVTSKLSLYLKAAFGIVLAVGTPIALKVLYSYYYGTTE
ncbi:hypothetical protein [Chitinophaga sp. CF418]|uniref:hypothetical protein n=1 Tax=Chitinophaga sp. CF418 TaxID=1855287 RepID=UPI000917D9D0|nr:hypothetical protein [Chitinophaga sp. CF418]SHN10241.1 hypothetical protein SAMN05216311_105157 [Chitinophaga sp. CF418]